jgi:hypothetical protein
MKQMTFPLNRKCRMIQSESAIRSNRLTAVQTEASTGPWHLMM